MKNQYQQTAALKSALILVLASLVVSLSAKAEANPAHTQQALAKFAGVYQLKAQQISTEPNSQVQGICYEQILVEQSENSQIDLQILGYPLGQGNVVVQMTRMNQGPQAQPIENPMVPGVLGMQKSLGVVTGSKISYEFVSEDNQGNVQHSTQFQGTLIKTKELEFTVRQYRSINGFEDSTARCRYVRSPAVR